MQFPKMYRALLVLQRQGWFSASIIELLWDTEDLHETIHVLHGLVCSNLAQIEYRKLGGRKKPGIKLPNFHVSFCAINATKMAKLKRGIENCSVKTYHRRFFSLETRIQSYCETGNRLTWFRRVYSQQFSSASGKCGLERELHELLRKSK